MLPSGAVDLTAWNHRIARARHLATAHPDASDLLTFYASLAEYQAALLKKGSGVFFTPTEGREKDSRPLFRDQLDTDAMASAIPNLLAWLQQNAPAALAATLSERQASDRFHWRTVIERYLHHQLDDEGGLETFIAEVVIQPFAEYVARSGATRSSEIGNSQSRCISCGGPPVLGVLREEGHGAKRTLLCGLCLTERDYLRVLCPACGEQRFDALPVYTADQFGHVRIEACDTCRTYLKTIDLTKDGTAVPVADDLASVSLDLWARDRGYQRLRPNLLRI
jgi:FdhE protein